MEDNIIGNQIMLLRKKFGLTQEDLAIKLGYSKQTVSNWETGLKTPRMGAIQKISDLFNVSKSFIIEGVQPTSTLTQITDTSAKLEEPRQKNVLSYAKEQLKEQTIRAKITSLEEYKTQREKADKALEEFYEEPNINVAIAAKASAGYGIENYCKNQILKTVTMKESNVPFSYDLAFEISGDSMEPVYHDKDIVFVKYDGNVYNRSIMIVEINGEAFLKKLFVEDNRLRLESLNDDLDENGEPLYPDRYAGEGDEIYIIGKVVN